MYDRDQRKIAEYARQGPDQLARVMQFVILTAHVKLASVPADFDTAEAGGNDAMGVLFGWKFDAYVRAWEHRRDHYSFAHHVLQHATDDQAATRELIEYFAGLVGFGPVKAGFICQLAFGLGGCLDTHNIKRFNVPARTFDNYCQLKSAKGRRAKIARYVDLVYRLGGPRELWDSWCHYVAEGQPALYRDADHVSALHCEALGID